MDEIQLPTDSLSPRRNPTKVSGLKLVRTQQKGFVLQNRLLTNTIHLLN